MVSKYRTKNGELLVTMIKNGVIKKDISINHGRLFHGAYEQLHLDHFKHYLGTVSRHLQNNRLETRGYDGD